MLCRRTSVRNGTAYTLGARILLRLRRLSLSRTQLNLVESPPGPASVSFLPFPGFSSFARHLHLQLFTISTGYFTSWMNDFISTHWIISMCLFCSRCSEHVCDAVSILSMLMTRCDAVSILSMLVLSANTMEQMASDGLLWSKLAAKRPSISPAVTTLITTAVAGNATVGRHLLR